jgi:hypothetical protein
MDKIIHHTVQLQCDPHHAFEMFTVNQLLQSWLVNVAEVEPVGVVQGSGKKPGCGKIVPGSKPSKT